MVLDDFILNHAHPGFFHRFPGQRNARLIRTDRRIAEHRVHLFLSEGGINLLRGLRFFNQGVQAGNLIKGFIRHVRSLVCFIAFIHGRILLLLFSQIVFTCFPVCLI